MVNWKLEAEPAQKSFDLQLMPMPLSCLANAKKLSGELFQLRILQDSEQNNKVFLMKVRAADARKVFEATLLPILHVVTIAKCVL